MQNEDDDGRLRDVFARLRAEEEGRMPGYPVVRARGVHDVGERPLAIRWWLPAAAVVAAVVLASVWIAPAPQPRPAFDWEPGQWSMPSDVLLDLSALPGSSVMGELEWTPTRPREQEGALRAPRVDDPRRRDERSFG